MKLGIKLVVQYQIFPTPTSTASSEHDCSQLLATLLLIKLYNWLKIFWNNIN